MFSYIFNNHEICLVENHCNWQADPQELFYVCGFPELETMFYFSFLKKPMKMDEQISGSTKRVSHTKVFRVVQ